MSKFRRTRNIVLSLLLAFLIIAEAGLIAAGISLGASLSRLSSRAQPVEGTREVSGGNVVNILVTGTDVSGKRTDSILVVSYRLQEKTLKIVSIPRDTLVKINGKREKINAVNGLGGESLLISTVESLLGIGIHYYVSVDYSDFDRIIDALGGVDMTIPYNMDYDDSAQNLHIHFTKGATVHLNGKQAEEFFRWRKNNDGSGLVNGDIGRTDNQHLFLEKVLEKVKSPAGMIRLPSLVDAVSRSVTTDMKASDILKYGVRMATVKKADIEMTTLQGSTPYIGGISYFVYDAKKNAALISSLQ